MTKGLRDAIYGLAVADALGVPYEFRQRGTFVAEGMVGYGTHNQLAGTWSDDTSMTLATCDSIKNCGRIDADDMRKRFCEWMNHGKYTVDGVVFDIGGATSCALRNGRGLKDINSNGNGSLMRMIPLAFSGASTEQITEVSSITHAHPISCDICNRYVSVLQELLQGKSLKEALSHCSGRVSKIYELDESEIKSTGYVVDTFEAAMWVLSTTDNYKDAILKAVNLGDDTDTVAAVTGGIAGWMYGIEEIPKEWIDTLRGKDIIDSVLF